MKKNLLVSLCLGTVFAVASQASASTCQINSGAYAGISAGLSTLSGNNQLTYSNDQVVAKRFDKQDSFKASLSKTSAAAAVFGGYGMKFGSLWTAAELFYQLDSLKDKQDVTLGTASGKNLQSSSTGAYGAAVHLGFLPSNNCIAYAILGAEVRSFKVKFSDATPTNIAASIKKGYRSTAFAPGVGVRFALAKNISIRTEYKLAMHSSKKLTNTTHNTGGHNDKVDLKHSPRVHSFNVGLVYSF